MPISDIMTTKLITIAPTATIAEIEPMFKQHRIHHLLVVSEQGLLGIVSDRDVLRNLSPFANTSAQDDKDAFLLNRKAQQIMSKRLVAIHPDAGIREACKVLLDNRVSLLPVVGDKKLVGVVSWKDILRYFVQ